MGNIMKRVYYVLAVAGLTVTGCMSPQGTPDYTASGALAGGATGAILGSMTHNHGAGTLVGGAVGAVVGGLVGHGMDQTQEARLRTQSPQTLQRIEQGVPLTVIDVKALVTAGVGDDLIISQIRNSRTVYHLNTTDIIGLKTAGASDALIDFMINTPSQIQSSAVVYQTRTVAPEPLYERMVPCPGPDCVWVAGSWFWFNDQWKWRGGSWHRHGAPQGPTGRSHYQHRP